MTPGRTTKDSQFFLCMVGDLKVAIDSSVVSNISDSHWSPAKSSEASTSKMVQFSTLLGLPEEKTTRTLIVKTQVGEFGIALKAIAKEEFRPATVKPVPALLGTWIRPSVVVGFALDQSGQQITTILDVERLLQSCSDRTPELLDAEKGQGHD